MDCRERPPCRSVKLGNDRPAALPERHGRPFPTAHVIFSWNHERSVRSEFYAHPHWQHDFRLSCVVGAAIVPHSNAALTPVPSLTVNIGYALPPSAHPTILKYARFSAALDSLIRL